MTQWMADVKADGHYTTTDGNGFFNFQGLHGQSLSIFISKDGYEFGYNVTGFNYSPMFDKRDVYQPNASAPEVFKMWKLRGPEPLISAEKLFGIKGDGTPFTIDLLKARKIEGRVASGDLVVKANQPTQIASGQRFDWSFDIDVIDGGLIEATNGQYNNEAPAEGYKPSISGAMKAGDREWSDEVTKRLFIKSRNGEQFAIVTVEVIADYHGSVAFGVKYLVNPKPGSRNLEYDPYKRLKPR